MSGVDQTRSFDWRHGLLLALTLVPGLLLFLLVDPIAQPQAYHELADHRVFLGISNFLDVTSNLAFLLTGLTGILVCVARDPGAARHAWITMFIGISLVSAGSVYYHLAPSDETLLWDRAAMTVGFMGLFVALLVEYLSSRLIILLLPLVIFGIASVLYGHWFDDLRLYACVQFTPLLMLPFVIVFFRGTHSHQWLLAVGLFWYVLAKVMEHFDHAVFHVTSEAISGHTAKHLLAAVACFSVLIMLWKRQQKCN